LSEEEEKRLSRLEKRLVPNVEFDDQALYYLGFGTDIYHMLGHLGWECRRTPTRSSPWKS
jgi:hypothetical protein